jgi:FkbM family methyltransferase
MTPLQRLARRLGYDLTPRAKARPLQAQVVAVLERFGISCVIDVGANAGQYGATLREWGYAHRIVSFEPQAEPHRRLAGCAAGDPHWRVAPRMALGEQDGEIELAISAESDMSSILPQSALLQRISPSSRIVGRERVRLARLDAVIEDYLKPQDAIFLKIDTQGSEAQVLAGARGLLPRLAGVQLEMPLVPCYEGERDFSSLLDDLTGAGFSPFLFLPGYFERKLARQLQVDGVFMRARDET